MTVWIVNPFDNLPVEGYRKQRYWLMAEAFLAAGHEVVCWTSDFSHANKAPRALRTTCAGAPTLRFVPTRPYAKNVSLRRFASHVALARAWHAAARASGEKPDLVIASAPPLLLATTARRFAKKCGAPFVLDVQDAWPETFERLLPRWALPLFRVALAPLRLLARRLYRGADAVTAVAARYLDLARAAGATAPMRQFRLGIELQSRSSATRSGRRGSPADAVRVVYAGNMSMSYDLATAVDAVKADAGFTLDLAGAGPDEASLRARASGCERIRFHGYLGDAALRSLLAQCDVGLVPMFDESCVGVPNKLADYAAAGLWIVNSLHGETENLLAAHAAGVTYAAGDKASLLKALHAPRGDGAASLAACFDAKRIYADYVAFSSAMW